jgi:hypothetical protein
MGVNVAFDVRPARLERRSFAIDAFTIRAEARAYLVAAGEMSLHEAVDGLQAGAVDSGLVEQLDQDQVQGLMAAAFETVRGVLWDLRDDVDPIIEMGADHGVTKQSHRIVARDGVASAAEMQRDYERATRQERVDHGLAPSTVAAFKYLLAQNDVEKLRLWLARRAPEERAELKRAMVPK